MVQQQINPLRRDPTRLYTLRRVFLTEMHRRFRLLTKRMIDLVVREDAFGLKESKPTSPKQLLANERFKFKTSPDKLREFREWLGPITEATVLGGNERDSDKTWWNKYIQEGYRKGTARAFDDSRKHKDANKPVDFYDGTRQEFLRSIFNNPRSEEKSKLLASRVYSELKGMTDDMAQRLSRIVVDGFVKGDNPITIGRNLSKQLDISRNSADRIARTETTRAHAEGQLDALEAMGVDKVGVMVEWITGPGACERCVYLTHAVLTISEARGLIPRHPNCCCCFTPANVGEPTKDQKRTKAEVKKAIDKSVQSEHPKDSLKEAKAASKWAGAETAVKAERPASILDSPTLPTVPTPAITAPIAVVPKATVLDTTYMSLEEKLAKNEELNSIRNAVAYGDNAELRRLQESISQTQSELALLNLQDGKRLERLRNEGKISQDKYAKDYKALVDKVGELEGRLQAARARETQLRSVDNTFKKMALDVKDRIAINLKDSDRESYYDAATGETIPIKRPADKAFNRSREEASKFLSSITKGSVQNRPNNLSITTHEMNGPQYRAFASSNQVYLPTGAPVSTFTHEMGHVLETSLNRARDLAAEFRDLRIKRSGKPDVKMTSVCPTCEYKPNEVGNPDDWEKLFGKQAAAYVGKIYSHGTTEVLSMGFEMLYANPVKFAQKDPEFFKFVVGVARGIL